MKGCSTFNNSSSSYIDVEIELFDECEEKIKRLFDQALLIFLEEEGTIRPLPAIFGNGEKVDLFKLFVLVREREGFDSVSRKGLWESVAEQLGFDCSVSPYLRLIYSKYLNRMEKWAAEKSKIVNWDNKESKKKGCCGGLLYELGDGFKGLLENGKCGKRNRAMVFGCKPMEELAPEFERSRKRFRESSHDNADDEEVENMSCDVLSDDSVCAEAEEEEEEGLDLSAEKHETLPGMLKWLSAVAKCPNDPSIGVIPHWSKWEEYSGNGCWMQVIRAKQALLVQRDNAEGRYQDSSFLGHQTFHPSMYEDNHRSTGQLRSSLRRHSNRSLVSLTKSGSNNCRELITTCKDLITGTSKAIDLEVYSSDETEIHRSYVPIGRKFQVQVNEWTGPGLSSDTKWLGTRIWTPKNKEALDQTLGKGRPERCKCDTFLPGSVECIRLHIAEKRLKLKREIGDFFFHWRFNQMGEEVSLRWLEREEKKFKEMMISDPQKFWINAVKCFHGKKKREDLVSYYYNVFLISRRRYQNRVNPRNVDSDDEEAFGCVGNSFGRDAVSPYGSDIMICSQSRQCFDFD